jgi:hypothetical protein
MSGRRGKPEGIAFLLIGRLDVTRKSNGDEDVRPAHSNTRLGR